MGCVCLSFDVFFWEHSFDKTKQEMTYEMLIRRTLHLMNRQRWVLRVAVGAKSLPANATLRSVWKWSYPC